MLFNRHKLRRHVARRLADGVSLPLHSANRPKRPQKDGAWHFSKPNPYSRDPSKRTSTRAVWAAIGLVLLSVAVFIFHPFFRLTQVHIAGASQIRPEEFKLAVEGILSYRVMGIFPSSNYYLANTDDVEDLLKKRFPLSSVHVQKKFPSTVQVTVEERISTIVYDDTKTYFLVGLDGRKVEAVRKVGDEEWINGVHMPDTATLQKEIGRFPIVVDDRLEIPTSTDSVLLPPGMLMQIIDFDRMFSSVSGESVRFFRLSKTANTIEVATSGGWQIYLDTSFQSSDTLRMLQVAHKQRKSASHFKYIDLRYPDRVYWQ